MVLTDKLWDVCERASCAKQLDRLAFRPFRAHATRFLPPVGALAHLEPRGRRRGCGNQLLHNSGSACAVREAAPGSRLSADLLAVRRLHSSLRNGALDRTSDALGSGLRPAG